MRKIKKIQLNHQKNPKSKKRFFSQGQGHGLVKVRFFLGFWGRSTRWSKKKFEIRMSGSFALREP
jgi:hypothetical protein